MTPFVLIDHGSGVAAAELAPAAAALTIQVNEHFGVACPKGWGASAVVRVGDRPLPDEWVLGLFATPDQPGALGYHDRTAHGLPVLKVFPPLCAKDGTSWTSCASHEVLEALADPEGCRAAQDPHGKFWALEVCDAVETDVYQIQTPFGPVEVSNFVLPCYFEPPSNRHGVKLDFMGLVTKPYEVRPGGYMQWFDLKAGWQQVQHAARPPRPYRQAVKGRGARRAAIGAASAHQISISGVSEDEQAKHLEEIREKYRNLTP